MDLLVLGGKALGVEQAGGAHRIERVAAGRRRSGREGFPAGWVMTCFSP